MDTLTFPPAFTVKINLADALSALVALAFVVVMALASGRLLGVRIGPWRAAVASLLGCTAGIVGAAEVDATHRGSLVLLSILFGVLGTMVVVIIIQALSAPRRRQRSRRRVSRALIHPVAWLQHRLSPLTRTWEVVEHARHRGLAKFQFMSAQALTTPEFGRRLRLTLEDSGGMFVKFGQIASTRTDLLGEAVTSELAELRSSVRPIPTEQLRPLVEEELSQPVEEVFASVDWQPLAAASIGQTHRAVLGTGEHVVFKIQRPGMEELMERDGTVLRFVASMAERRLPGARRLGVRDLAEDLVSSLGHEVDYLREAAMSERLAAKTDDTVCVPAVYSALCTPRLLVMEEAVGAGVDDALAVETCGRSRDLLARSLLRTFLRQVLQDGVYHADPHPGNVLVDSVGRLWLLDFGAVGILDPRSRESLQEMTLGMTIAEPVMIARAVRSLSGDSPDTDLRQLTSEIGLLMVESSSGGFDPKMLRQVLTVMNRHGLRVPRPVTQLSRALVTLDGTLQTISPGFDLRSEASGVVRQLHDVEGQSSSDVMRNEVIRALPVLRALPEHVDELANQLRAGRLSVRVERFAGQDQTVVNRWVDRVVLAAVGIGGVLASALLLLGAGVTHSPDVGDALRAVGFIGLVMSAVLLLRSVAQVLQRDREPPAP